MSWNQSSIWKLLLVLLALPSGTATAEGTDRLGVEDYLAYEQVSDAQISPDGEQIVFTRRWVDVQNDKWKSSLWIMDSDGSRLRYLVDGSNARWSPSGDRILFLTGDANGATQIFVRWLSGDDAVSQVTRGTVKPYSPTWSPDGRWIAFAGIVAEENNWDIPLPTPPKDAKWTEPPRMLDELYYRQDKVGYRELGHSHLFVVSAASGAARQLTHGDWQVGAGNIGLYTGAGISWMPDSKKIVFDGLQQANENLYRHSNIYSIDIETAETVRLTGTDGNWSNPQVSPDGSLIAYMGHEATNDTYKLATLYVASSDGEEASLVAPGFEQPVVGNLFWDDRNRLHFSARQQGYTHVFSVDLKGQVKQITEGESVSLLNSMTASRQGAGTRTSIDAPSDIYLFDLPDGNLIQLTDVNADLLKGKTLASWKEIWFEAEDGNRAHGWMVLPPEFDNSKKYPLLMEIHGGPFSMYRGRFDFGYQIYAANDFVVLYTNPRGSTGYGEAFSQAINHAYPSVDYLDLMAAVDKALDQGYIDENRLYVGGCSGGGVLTSWVIGHTDRFAAASVRCPVSNWMSMLGQTDVPHFTLSFFKEPFWKNPEPWLRHSSIMHVGKVTTPTIVMTGEQDLRTPMAQSEEYYAALKLNGVPARLLRFNDQYHGTSTRPSNAMRTWLYLMSWYNQYDENGEREAKPDQ